MASTLDMGKLRKVRALMDGGKTEGERGLQEPRPKP